MPQEFVLGIDGGGTYTRAAIADMDGNILGFALKEGSHSEKNHHPEINVKTAIQEAIHQAGVPQEKLRHIVAGFAGLNSAEDLLWAKEYIKASGIECGNSLVNDAVIAQYGAFIGEPGILAIAGTGSIVLGKNQEEKLIRNYDFHHDSEAGARYLAYWSIYELITHTLADKDKLLAERVMNYWGVSNLTELGKLASSGFGENRITAIKKLSGMGEIVTSEARNGSRIALNASGRVASSLITGIELVASEFNTNKIQLALEGSVAKNSVIKKMILDELENNNSFKTYELKDSIVSPVLGAILYAYQKLGVGISPQKIENLKTTESAETN